MSQIDLPDTFFDQVENALYDAIFNCADDFINDSAYRTIDTMKSINTMDDEELISHLTKHPDDEDMVIDMNETVAEILKLKRL